MKIEKTYTAQAHVVGGRDGHVTTNDNALNLQLSAPKAMGGAGKAGATNPEQLFAAGYAACFEGALGVAARQAKITLPRVAIESLVSIGKAEDGGFGIAVDLTVNIEGMDQQQAENLVQQADQICPYSRATRGNIEVNLTTTTN